MILIGAETLATIAKAAERAYPEECCGLLIGRRSDGAVTITRARASPNVAGSAKTRRFEIDPALRFDLTRALRGGLDAIVGHYHSHPDHPAEPSPTDVAAAFEPDLVWLITAVPAGRAGQTAAFRIDGERVIRLDLVITKSSSEPT